MRELLLNNQELQICGSVLDQVVILVVFEVAYWEVEKAFFIFLLFNFLFKIKKNSLETNSLSVTKRSKGLLYVDN